MFLYVSVAQPSTASLLRDSLCTVPCTHTNKDWIHMQPHDRTDSWRRFEPTILIIITLATHINKLPDDGLWNQNM